MKPLLKKSLVVLAALGLSLPLAPVTPVAQAQEALPVVNLIPAPETSAQEKGLVTIRLVAADGTVHKTLYYTSVNTDDVTLVQVYDLLKATYELDKTPRDIKAQADKQHYVTNKGEFDGHSLEASFVLTKPETVPVDPAEPEPAAGAVKTYAVTELPQKNPVVDAQLMTVKVQDQAQQELAATHYLVNSDTTASPFEAAAKAFTQAHPNYHVDATQVQQVGQADPAKKEDVLTSEGTVNVYRSTYVLTAVLAGGQQASDASQASGNGQASAGSNAASGANQASGANESSATSNQASGASQASGANSTASGNEQASGANQGNATNQASGATESSSTAQASSESVRYDKNGRRLPSTGELKTVYLLLVAALAMGLSISLIVLDRKRRER